MSYDSENRIEVPPSDLEIQLRAEQLRGEEARRLAAAAWNWARTLAGGLASRGATGQAA